MTSTIIRPTAHRGAGPRYAGPVRPSPAGLQVARPMARRNLDNGRARYAVGPRHILATLMTLLVIGAALAILATSGTTMADECSDVMAGTDAAPADVVAICSSVTAN